MDLVRKSQISPECHNLKRNRRCITLSHLFHWWMNELSGVLNKNVHYKHLMIHTYIHMSAYTFPDQEVQKTHPSGKTGIRASRWMLVLRWSWWNTVTQSSSGNSSSTVCKLSSGSRFWRKHSKRRRCANSSTRQSGEFTKCHDVSVHQDQVTI